MTASFDGAHTIAAAVRTPDGIHGGVSPPANTGAACSCAEPVAVGSAVAAGVPASAIETRVAGEHPTG